MSHAFVISRNITRFYSFTHAELPFLTHFLPGASKSCLLQRTLLASELFCLQQGLSDLRGRPLPLQYCFPRPHRRKFPQLEDRNQKRDLGGWETRVWTHQRPLFAATGSVRDQGSKHGDRNRRSARTLAQNQKCTRPKRAKHGVPMWALEEAE